jgi:hypothetical protein
MATARKAPAKRAAAKKAPAGKTAATKVAKKAVKKKAVKKTVKKAAPRKITAKKALANTRRLLAQKQAQARGTPAWQALDHSPAGMPHPGFQSDEARTKAGELHEAGMRLEANQGSVSTVDRHNQGKRDQR